MSSLQVSNITDGTNSVETVYVARGSAKAWVNFNGTGTIAARDSLNLSSLTDNGTGIYIVNFTNNFAAANYTPTASGRGENNVTLNTTDDSIGTSSSQVVCVNSSGSTDDSSHVYFTAQGDLA